MTTYTLPRDLLLAVSHAAAKDDIRFYINGVMLDIQKEQTYIVGTNGHILAAAIYRTVDAEPHPQIILPLEAVQQACKAKSPMVELTLPDAEDGVISGSAVRFQLGSVVSKAIDGKFPDWRKVCPDFANLPPDGAAARFDADYFKTWVAVGKAVGVKPHQVYVWSKGHDGAYVQFAGKENELFGVFMPLRVKPSDMLTPNWM